MEQKRDHDAEGGGNQSAIGPSPQTLRKQDGAPRHNIHVGRQGTLHPEPSPVPRESTVGEARVNEQSRAYPVDELWMAGL